MTYNFTPMTKRIFKEGNYSFKNSFQIAKNLTCIGCKRVASKLFSTIRKNLIKACYCFRFNYYYSIRANTRACRYKDKNFLLLLLFSPEDKNILMGLLIPTVFLGICILGILWCNKEDKPK